MSANNYFKVYCATDAMLGVFPFDGTDSLSIQRAWEAAVAFRVVMDREDDALRGEKLARDGRDAPPKVISVWLPVVVRGPWSAARQIGFSGVRGEA